MSLFYQPGIPEGVLHLDRDESRHAAKVLRMKTGDTLQVTDGAGSIYEAQILLPDFNKCTFRIVRSNHVSKTVPYRHIAIAPTKNADRMEWFAEKAVELGVDEISFFHSKNSERKTINLDRIQKIAISAMKQSQQSWLPVLSELKSFTELLTTEADQKFIAYVDSANPVHLKELVRPSGIVLVLIGPEGDFSETELAEALSAGFQKVSLGKNRLRTETAAIAACHLLNLSNGQDWQNLVSTDTFKS